MWKIGTLSLGNIGVVLGFLGGFIAVGESLMVTAFMFAGHGLQYGYVGLTVAIVTVAGATIAYKRSMLMGALTMLFSSLIGQLTGGITGLALNVLISPPPSPIYNETFLVSSWTVLSLIGSIIILLSLRKNKK